MHSAKRPEHAAPPELWYNKREAEKYSTNSRILQIQRDLAERAFELLQLPGDGVPRLLLDLGCGSGLSGKVLSSNGHHWVGIDISRPMLGSIEIMSDADGDNNGDSDNDEDHSDNDENEDEDEAESDEMADDDTDGCDQEPGDFDLILRDLGEGVPFRPGSFDGAISISAVQWLCNADQSNYNPKKRLEKFFSTLLSSLCRGARAVLQFYPENAAQISLITNAALRCGFNGGMVVDNPQSKRSKKYFLVLNAGYSAGSLPKALGISEEKEVCHKVIPQVRGNEPFKKQRSKIQKFKNKRTKEWILHKKERARLRGVENVPANSKYTGRKRRPAF